MDLKEPRHRKAGRRDVGPVVFVFALAESVNEVEASWAFRYRVFCDEMARQADTGNGRRQEREYDSFDAYCDHLLVFDEARGKGPDSVVGTYRLMRRDSAQSGGASSTVPTSSTFRPWSGVSRAKSSRSEDPASTGITAPARPCNCLWRGIAAYIFHFNIDILFGCGELARGGPRAACVCRCPISTTTTWLRPRAGGPGPWPSAMSANERTGIVRDRARGRPFVHLRPWIKGYLRLGGFVGDGAVVDPEFGTTDVCIVVKTDRITEKYLRHYSREEMPRVADGT